MARRLGGKVAVITGGASGIGECTAKLFVRHGARVIVADIQDDKGREVCAALGSAAEYVHCDVTNESDVERSVSTAVSLHGKLDIMFNNAGVMDASVNGVLTTERAEFEHVMASNALGVFLGTKHAARAMVAGGRGGSIVSTASVAAAVGGMASAAYTCSKHAVVGLMRSAAAELGRYGVRVNCVSPFAVATPLTMRDISMSLSAEEVEDMVEKFGNLKGVRLKAEDVAEAALYLGSDESKYVSGVNLMVDGGISVSKSVSGSPEEIIKHYQGASK